MFKRTCRAFSDIPKRIGFIFAVVVLPIPGAAQEQASPGMLSQSVNIPALAQQFSDSKQFVDNSLRETREAVIALSPIDGNLLELRYPQTQSGISDRISAYSNEQTQFMEDYAEMMALRTEALFNLWESASAERVTSFFQTGSIYPIIVPDPEFEYPEPPDEAIELPGEFPGFPVQSGGFFAHAPD